MYCSKCGYKLVSGKNNCTNCNEPISKMEACGGFWGLVGEEERPAKVPVANSNDTILSAPMAGKENVQPEAERPVKKKEPKGTMRISKKFFTEMIIFCFLLFCISVFFVFKTVSLSNEIKNLNEEIDVVSEEPLDQQEEVQEVEENKINNNKLYTNDKGFIDNTGESESPQEDGEGNTTHEEVTNPDEEKTDEK